MSTIFQNVTVNPAITTTVTAYPTWYIYGNMMTFTSNTGPVTGPGTVEFRDTTNSADLGGGPATNGHATFQTSTLSAGIHMITATYYGDDGSPLSSGQININIAKSQTYTLFAWTGNGDDLNWTPEGVATATYTGDPVCISPYVYDQPLGKYATSIEGVALVYDFEQILPDGGLKDLGHTAPTNAGSYVLTASFAGSDDYTSSVMSNDYGHGIEPRMLFDILKADATVTVTPYDITYDGASHTAVGSAIGVNGEWLSGLDLSTTTHTNATGPAGSVDTFTFTNPNYNTVVSQVFDRIGKVDAIINVTGYDTTYDGLVHTATGTAIGVKGELLCGLDLTGTQHTNANGPAGSVDTFTFTDKTGNYNDLESQVFDRIGKADATGVQVTPYSVTYDGNVHTATGVNPVGDLDLTRTEHTDAGIYNDQWFFHGGLNYNDQYGWVADIIYKADASDLIKVTPYTVTYDGNAHTATGVPAGNLDLTRTEHTDAGVYTDTWFFHGGLNYNDTHGTVVDTIGQANATVKVTPYNVTYDGAGHTATGTATGVNGTNLATDLTIVSAHTNAGVYSTDSWSFTNPNYVSQSGKMTDTINKANAPGIKVLPYNVTYNGAVHTATGVNPVGDLDLTKTEHTNAGTYTDTWFFHGGQNYNDTHGTVTDVIGKANATVKVTPYNVNYNAVVHSATGTVIGVNGALPSSDLTIVSAHTNAGVYNDSWTFNDPNYVAQSGRFTDVIGKANVAVKVAPYNVTYNGAWHAATGTVTGVNGQPWPD